MESLDPTKVLDFIDQLNTLKHSSRRGWIISEVKEHERIAGHMYAMGMMTFLLGDASELDRFRCLQLALVHDLSEAIVGDITPHDAISVEEKHRKEAEAMREITKDIGDVGALILKLYEEYEAKETAEAKFVKDLDRLDLLCTAVHYEKRDNIPGKLQEYFDGTEGKFEHPFIKKLVDQLKVKRGLDRRTSTETTKTEETST